MRGKGSVSYERSPGSDKARGVRRTLKRIRERKKEAVPVLGRDEFLSRISFLYPPVSRGS